MKTYSTSPSLNEKKLLIPCPICGGEVFENYWDCHSFYFVKCNNCDLIFQNPQPVFEELDNRYDQDYFEYEQENDDIFFDLMLKGLSDINFNPSGFNKSSSFLDIGCATGLLVEYMQSLGWRSKGVELCGPAAEYGSKKRNIEIFSGTVEQAMFEDNSFDVIHCSHLIEHLNNPSVYIDEIKRILKPGGVFLCITPNSDGFQAKLFGSKWRSAIADHMFLFSRKTLINLLRNKNFDINKVKTWGGIGKGFGPGWFKNIMDYSAKKLHFGDVMIISAQLQK